MKTSIKIIQIKYLILFFIFCPIQDSYASKKSVDSLSQRFYIEKKNEIKKEILFELLKKSRSYPKDSFTKYLTTYKNFITNQDDKDNYDFFQLNLYYKKGAIDSFNTYFKKVNKKLNANNTLRLNSALTGCFIKQKKYKEAYELAFKNLIQAEKTKNLEYILRFKTELGWCKMEMGQMEDAIKWFLNVDSTTNLVEFEFFKQASYNNLAACYGALGDLNKAIYYNDKAIKLSEKYHDIVSLPNNYFIKGDIQIEFGKYQEAEKYYIKAVEIRKSYGDPFFIVSDLSAISGLYATIHKPQLGIEKAKEALAIAEKENLESKKIMIYESLSYNYYEAKDYKNYSNTLKKLIELKDKTYKENTEKEMANLNVKYESAKKEILINKQKNDLNKKNLLLAGSLLSLIMLSLLAWFIIKNIRNKSKAVLKEQQLIAKINASKSIFNAEENERLRIAKDLHDGIGQLLSAMKLNLQTLDDKQLENPTIVKVLDIVDDCATEARQIAHNIMPHHLIEKGLSFALKDLVEKVNNPKLEVKMDIIGLENRLDAELEIPIYRIIQESINNIIRHAKATSVYISLEKDSNNVTCSIEDNGIGFDTNIISKKGIGLENMESRILYLNGTLEIHSQMNKGTLITFNLPQNMSFKDE
jgi:two-component system NarL family sensor kinase